MVLAEKHGKFPPTDFCNWWCCILLHSLHNNETKLTRKVLNKFCSRRHFQILMLFKDPNTNNFCRQIIHMEYHKPLCCPKITIAVCCRSNWHFKSLLNFVLCWGGSLSRGDSGGLLEPPPSPLFLNNLWKWYNFVSLRPNYFIFLGVRKMR